MPSSIQKALNELPTTLDGTYERALQEIPKEKRQHANRLFQCLVAAIRPLRAGELADIFAIDFDRDATCNFMENWRPEYSEEAVLSTCSTLISIIDHKGSRVVQFSHFTVKEFLTSNRLRTSELGSIRYYYVPLDAAHAILAQACLIMLLQLDKKADKKCLETFPLVLYAAQHWVEHAMYEDVALRVQGSMEDLFSPKKPHLEAWISIHDVAQRWRQRHFFKIVPARHSPPGAAALFYAALCGFSKVAGYLIMSHAEKVNGHYRNFGRPLHVASSRGHTEVVRLLLRHNADLNVGCTSHYNWTPLHFASWNGHPKVVQLLLEHGVNINAQSTSLSTPLKFASESGHLEVVRLLLRKGADVHIRDKYGRSPCQRATCLGHIEVVRLLLEHGAEKV
jgi:Ankyrin repeats (3 copies)